jgi:hypothetical protein
VVELLPGHTAVILEDADVLKPDIAFEVLNALSAEGEILFDLAIVGVPEMTIMPRVLDNDFMRADRAHFVIKSVTRTAWIAVDPVKRMRMDHSARRPRAAVHGWRGGDNLQGQARLRAEGTQGASCCGRLGLVTADNP